MKKFLLLLIISSFLSQFCGTNDSSQNESQLMAQTNDENLEVERISSKTEKQLEDFDLKLNFSSIQEKFTYQNLIEFKMDTIEWKKRKNIYQNLNNSEFYQIYQDTSISYEYSKYEVDLQAFYSFQKTPRNTIEITILYQYEGSYCEGILYQVYNLEGYLISSFRVAGGCSDGGYYNENYGKFINDSVYILNEKHNMYTKNIDSVEITTQEKRKISIKYDGTIESKLLLTESK